MLSRQGYLGRARGNTSLWLVVAGCFLFVGYVLGQPGVKPYLVDILLLTLGVCFIFIAAGAAYLFVTPVQASEKPKSIFYACAVSVFLLALFFVGKWISTLGF